MHRVSAMLITASFAAFGVAFAAPQAPAELTDGSHFKNFDTAGNANWHIAENTVAADRGNGFLVTRQSYGDFRLRAEVWLDDIANSGIFIRCDNPEQPTPATCYEVNLFDTRPDQSYGTGAIVNVARVNPMPKSGLRWNVMEIEARGPQLTVRLNGQQTASARDTRHPRGRIAFQYGQGVVRWRKIEITPL